MNARGFTLVEIAIVLVIIGLIVGGVLSGKELVLSAKVNAQVQQFEEFNVAIAAFRNKYNCIPGDCDHASQLGLGTSGNGNGNIDDVPTLENHDFWLHLEAAGLVPTLTYSTYYGFYMPQSKIAGGFVWADVDNVWAIVNTATTADCSGDLCPVLSPVMASWLDRKMDDGLPYAGSVTVTGGFTDYAIGNASTSEGAAGSDVCVSTDVTPNIYDESNANLRCIPLVAFKL